MSQGFLLTGETRRRDWSDERKLELLAEAFGPCGSVSKIARRESISTCLVYRWRNKFSGKPGAVTFAPPVLSELGDGRLPVRGELAVMMVEVASGARVRIRGSAPPALVVAVLKALV